MPTAMNKCKVMIVDDHPIIREGFGDRINEEPDMEVCGGASTAEEGMEMIESLHPDLVIMDITLKDESGIRVAGEIKERFPSLPVIMLSMHEEAIYAEHALQAGARGYLNKREGIRTIIDAIRTVLSGEIYLSEEMKGSFLERLSKSNSPSGGDMMDRLSPRERQIFVRVGQGMTAREISHDLELSLRTIETYRDHLRAKLGLKNITELVNRAAIWIANQAETSAAS